ncbi:hypothetical protein, partial [Burkholderia cenocepacia]|uniref:hypothetical protein n=1 Tax=Burkholderia cenocepacia TaxID=95486 RepID=UPI001C0CC39E
YCASVSQPASKPRVSAVKSTSAPMKTPSIFMFSVVEIGRLEPYGNARKGRVKGIGAGVKNA